MTNRNQFCGAVLKSSVMWQCHALLEVAFSGN